MRIKPLISMGLALMLIVPTIITAANPELAHAKTSSKTSSKKMSAKAKSVVAKIKAINPKKTNYISKTKAAVSAYKKLSKKDKKKVYNYSTLKKHWSKTKAYLKKIDNLKKKVAALNTKNYTTKIAAIKKQYSSLNKVTKAAVPKTTVKKINYYANRKANLVIAKIKAINPKKSDYIIKTKAAVSAYKKLSKTDKKKVKNYATLKKYWKNIQPYLKKIDALSKSVAALNSSNFTTKSVTLQKKYDSLNAATKAAVPSKTLTTLSYYSDVVSTNKLVLMAVDSSPSTSTEDGTKILAIINAYKKLSGAQQSLLKDLISDNSEAKANLDRYLALENIIKKAADIEKKYAALSPVSKAKPQDLVALYNDYKDVEEESIDYKLKDASGNEIEPGTEYKVSDFVSHAAKINEIGTAYAAQIQDAKDFTTAVNGLTNDSTTSSDVQNVVTNYKDIQGKQSADSSVSGYPALAPIDLVDKNVLTTYNKFAPIPDMVTNFKKLPVFPTSIPSSLTTNDISKIADLLAQYNKLGADQKKIVQNALESTSNNAKDYLSEAKNISSAQTIDKNYDSALKNKAKSSYFSDLKKVYDAYNAATPEVKRFVVNATNINDITKSGSDYSKALADANDLKQAIEGLNENSTLSGDAGINAVVAKYKDLSNQIPTPLSLVDSATLKTYNQFAAIPDVVKSVNKIPNKAEPTTEGAAYGYKTNDITNILAAIKAYKKLGSTQQTIVDNETKSKTPTIAALTEDESNITAAQKIDSAYTKLKKSSSTYPKDAKKVYQSYDDASGDVLKYIVNVAKIKDLLTTFTTEQSRANTFEEKVNALSKKSKIADVESAVDYYNTYISTSPKVSSLVDKAVLKKYNDYAPVSNVVKLLSLIKESDVNSPSVTPTDVKYIQQATVAYNALKTDPKMIIDDADRSKFPFLYDEKYITEAVAIDKAYEKVKPTDEKYELEILDVYYNLYDRAPAVVQKYVANKAELDKIGTRYAPQLTIARDFETMVRQMSHISETGSTPTVSDVRDLEEYYENKVKYNPIDAKYNVALQTLIDPEVMATYNKYLPILQIQDIAKSMYVQYGKLFNEENLNLDKIKDTFYNKVKSSYPIVGYTDSGKWDGNPIKVTNPNDIQAIYKAIDYYNQLETPQRAILEKAPTSLGDRYYEDKYGITYNGNHVEKDVIRPSIPLSDGEIQNFLKAQEFDKEFEALSPSNKSYIQQAIALYYKFDKAGKPVQIYAIHEKEIVAFKNNYNTDKLIAGIDNFVNAVNKLSNDSSLTDIVDGGNGVVDQYNKLNEAQLSVIDKGVLTKYNAYAPIADIIALTPSAPASGSAYKDADIDAMLKAITIYKKLTKDPKAIINVKNDPYQYLTQEADIKAAQKVDKAFKALDKTDDKYVTNLKKVIQDYDALSDTAKGYVTSKAAIDAAKENAAYKTPSEAAKAFEELIVGTSENDEDAWLNMDAVPYDKIKAAVDRYESLSSKAQSLVDSDVMKIYNKYAPIVEIVETLENVTPADINDLTEDISTGYYKTQYPERDIGTEILNAIQAYNKLGSDQKDIVKKELGDSRVALLDESNNIKAAQALDKKIAAIKPKSSSYVKGIIDAQKTLNTMPKEQRVYLQNVDILDGYDKTGSQTAKAIDDLTKFEQGVQKVDEWTSQLKDENGDIANTCKENDTDSSGIACNTAITSKMGELATVFDQLNTPRIVDGAETKLASLIDRTILARYQYFRAIYDVIDQL